MACGDKTNLRCGTIQYAVCVKYEGELPEYSELECANIEETTEELYNLITEIKEQTDMSQLEADCINYPTERTVLNVLQAMQDFICTQAQTITDMQAQMEVMEQQIIDLQEGTCP